jgi:glutathione S-transferase
VEVSIFEGAGRTPEFLALNPTGKVPVLQLDDGRALAESNAILAFLADGTPYLPSDPFAARQGAPVVVVRTGERRSRDRLAAPLGDDGKTCAAFAEIVEAKRNGALRTLALLDRELAQRALHRRRRLHDRRHRAVRLRQSRRRADVSLAPFAAFRAWVARVEAQPGFLADSHPYSIDPHSAGELP